MKLLPKNSVRFIRGRSITLAARKLTAALLCSCMLYPVVSLEAQENKAPEAYVDDESEEQNLWLTLSVPFYNKYYYRGIELYPDSSLQPSVSLSYSLGELGNIGASVWAHIPIGNNQDSSDGFDEDGNFFRFESSNEFVEVDPSIYYDVTLGPVTLSLGHLWYTDPSEGTTSFISGGEEVIFGSPSPDTAEVFAGVAVDTILQPSLTVYHDYREFNYQYYALSFSERIDSESLGLDWGEDFNVTPYVLFGFASSASSIYNDESGLKHVNLGVRTTLYAGPVRITPIIQFNIGADKSLEGVDRTEDDFIMGIDFALDTGFGI